MREWKKFERDIERMVREDSGLTYNSQRKVVGESGTIWRVDGVLFENDDPVSYLEIKHIGSKSEAETQYKLAFSQMADFRYSNIPGAVVVPEKRYPGNKNWDEYFATIGCILIGKDQFHDFLDFLQTMPGDFSVQSLLEDYISETVWDHIGDKPLNLAEEQSGSHPGKFENIVEEYFDNGDN